MDRVWLRDLVFGERTGAPGGCFSRALELANQMGDLSARLHARGAYGRYGVRVGISGSVDLPAITRHWPHNVGDQADAVLGDRILGLTHHYVGNQAEAGLALERVRAIVRQTGTATDTDFQLDFEVAVPSLLARILWLQGFPDQALAALQRRSTHRGALTLVFTLLHGLPGRLSADPLDWRSCANTGVSGHDHEQR